MRVLAVSLLAIAFAASSALAGKPDAAGKGKGHAKSEDRGSSQAGRSERGVSDGDGRREDREGDHFFSSHHRDLVRVYYGDHYGRGCPPGLAKKHNGCLPPGIAKKRYSIGRPLPQGIVLVPLPYELVRILGPAPYGYRYGLVDGDVVKLAIGTMLVADAIDGLLE